jgi:MATE family multidrug resistance protein
LAGWLCITVSVTVMSIFALGYWFFPEWLLSWFTKDPEAVAVGTRILLLVALFQIADGLQVSATGALRGAGNTHAEMFANLIGHYPIGLTLGLILCFGLGWGVLGIWGGLAAGLVTVALLVLRAWVMLTREPATMKAILVPSAPPRFET